MKMLMIESGGGKTTATTATGNNGNNGDNGDNGPGHFFLFVFLY
jgi:hypothetical protein